MLKRKYSLDQIMAKLKQVRDPRSRCLIVMCSENAEAAAPLFCLYLGWLLGLSAPGENSEGYTPLERQSQPICCLRIGSIESLAVREALQFCVSALLFVFRNSQLRAP